jgi:hypothetical protein
MELASFWREWLEKWNRQNIFQVTKRMLWKMEVRQSKGCCPHLVLCLLTERTSTSSDQQDGIRSLSSQTMPGLLVLSDTLEIVLARKWQDLLPLMKKFKRKLRRLYKEQNSCVCMNENVNIYKYVCSVQCTCMVYVGWNGYFSFSAGWTTALQELFLFVKCSSWQLVLLSLCMWKFVIIDFFTS